ncbi:MAG TPA: Fe-S-containing protein [Bacteroidota bacterium]|nr:Fe-S-containing protein [Bacteroidota bacterium]
MIESMIIALREGIEISLVVGILIVYLKKINKPSLITSVYAGLVLAVLASIGGALILQKLSIDQESLEGFFMIAAAVFVISMIAWMWVTAKKIRREIEAKVNSIVESTTSRKSQISILSFTFLMVAREGIETAVFLQAVALSTDAWRSILGTVMGIGAATIFAILFIRGSVRIDIGRFLRVTAITLLIFTLQLIVNAFHEFYEYGILPASPRMMGILGPVVQNNIFFIIAIVSIPAIMLLIPSRMGRRTPAPAAGKGSSGDSGVQTQQTSPAKAQGRWQLSAGIASICIIFFLGVGDIFSSNYEMDLTAEAISSPSSGVIEIPVARISDNNIHRYSIDDRGLTIRFFVLRTGLGKFATAFDACYACYSYGRYYLKNGQLICSQCDAPSPLSKLHATKGEAEPDENNSGSMEGNGCTPIYLASRLKAGNIEIKLADLESKRKYFDISGEEK